MPCEDGTGDKSYVYVGKRPGWDKRSRRQQKRPSKMKE
jgi:hypothetical protein